MCKKMTGFTMVEILVVTVIIAALVALAIPVVMSARRTAVKAGCTENLLKISQALIAYRQDNHVYPDPDKPINTLAEAYAKTLAKVPTCPHDPETGRDTYGEFYNYWGYNSKTSPEPLQSKNVAEGVYAEVMDLLTQSAAAVQWNADSSYIINTVVDTAEYPGVQFLCTKAHLSGGSTKPLSGKEWQQYWTIITPPDQSHRWIMNEPYSVNDVVVQGEEYFLCLKGHTSDDYVDENKDHAPDDVSIPPDQIPDVTFDGNSYEAIQSQPRYGKVWQQYWILVSLPAIWQGEEPDSDFPGLANPNAPGNTIVTLCPHHVTDIRKYLVLRVSGDVENVSPPSTDKYFWALSR